MVKTVLGWGLSGPLEGMSMHPSSLINDSYLPNGSVMSEKQQIDKEINKL